MYKKINKNFYNRYTPKVARDLLGCFLVREIEGKEARVRITETEAYRGEYDLACHASKGRTSRTEGLYGEPGTAYIYLIYGMYWMLNVVTEKKDFPAAVLVRAVELEGREPVKRLDGPGKLTKFLQIDRNWQGHDLTKGKGLWLELPLNKTFGSVSVGPQRRKIVAGPRIGVDYARHCRRWKWNFRLV